MDSLSVIATGMVTNVGLDTLSSCAAIRVGINNFEETHFIDSAGEWIIAGQVALSSSWYGIRKHLEMVCLAIDECFEAVPHLDRSSIPLLICLAEKERPGRLAGLDTSFLSRLEKKLGYNLHRDSQCLADGAIGGLLALQKAKTLIRDKQATHCLIAGVDSYLTSDTLKSYDSNLRLLTSSNSNGFVPGEGGAALLVCAGDQENEGLKILGIGLGKEEATVDSELPLRANGLTDAIKAAEKASIQTVGDLDFRITDLNGEHYYFKEATIALQRTLKVRKEEFDIWHPNECTGELGAATLPILIGVALVSGIKSYSPGPGVLVHLGNDSGNKGALILKYSR